MIKSRLSSLRIRVLLFSSIGMLVFAIVITVFFARLLTANLRDGLRTKAESIAALLAYNLEAAVDFDSADDAERTVAGIRKDEDYLAVSVTRLDGTRMVGEAAAKPVPLDPKSLGSTRVVEGDDRISAIAPILVGGKAAGAVEVAFRNDRVAKAASVAHVAGLLVCLVLAVIVTAYLVYMMGRVIVGPVVRITSVVNRLGDGDLSPIGDPPSRMSSELAGMYAALGRATAAFRENVGAITAASDELFAMADGIRGDANVLSAAVGEQAAAVSETSVTLEEVEKTGHFSADSADRIVAAAAESLKASEQGLAAVNAGLFELRGIKAQVDEIADNLQQLNARLKEVDAIVASVNDVSRQSHTLSINASIEAAKAGEVGAGFSIVANQMRSLAEQSKEANERVRTTLGQVRAAIMDLTATAEEGRAATEKGVATTERAGEVIQRMTAVVNETSRMARVIAGNVQQQLTGLQQTSTAMTQINSAAQSNLGGIRSVESMGADLNRKASSLRDLVARFRI